jgi:exopolysaccharide production protein ExoQ
MTWRSIAERAPAPGVVALCLLATAVLTTLAASFDALVALLAGLLLLGAGAIAIARPTILFYAYCAAIPFNFALPPGPAGTVARIVGVLFFVGYLVRDPGGLHPRAVPWAGWLFLAWSLVTVLWAIDTQVAFSAWLSLAQLFAVTVLIASIVSRRPATARTAVWSYSIAATATAAVAILSYIAGTGIFSRATAFADQDPALFSSIVLPAAVVLLDPIQDRTSRLPVRAGALVALVICVVALMLSGTRSAWIGFVVATAVWFVVRRDWRQLLAVAVLAVSASIFVMWVPEATDFLAGRVASSLASGGSGRTDIWAVGLSILASAPLLGVGLANFGEAFTPYAISQASASNASGALFADRGAHNVYLGTTVETGLLGGALLIILIISAFTLRATDRVVISIRLALLSLVVQAFFLDILGQKQIWLFMALAFGLAASHAIAGGSDRQEDPAVPAREGLGPGVRGDRQGDG